MKSEKILVITAHPDDPEFGCGGTIAKKTKAGAVVSFVLVTDGEKGSRDKTISPKELKRLRQQEQKDAANVLGVKEVIFLHFPDGELEPSLDLRESLTRVIRECQPDIVYTHDPTSFYFRHRHMINHPDHRAVGEAALAAIFPSARDTNYFPHQIDEGLSTHNVEKIFLFNTDHWTYWEDISSFIDLKIEALLKHKSQFDDPDDMVMRYKKYAKILGKKEGMGFAEVFKYLDLQTKEIQIPG